MTADPRELVEVTPDMATTINRRVKALRHIKVNGMTKAAFAKLCGVPGAIMNGWLNGRHALPSEHHDRVDAVLERKAAG